MIIILISRNEEQEEKSYCWISVNIFSFNIIKQHRRLYYISKNFKTFFKYV